MIGMNFHENDHAVWFAIKRIDHDIDYTTEAERKYSRVNKYKTVSNEKDGKIYKANEVENNAYGNADNREADGDGNGEQEEEEEDDQDRGHKDKEDEDEYGYEDEGVHLVLLLFMSFLITIIIIMLITMIFIHIYIKNSYLHDNSGDDDYSYDDDICL